MGSHKFLSVALSLRFPPQVPGLLRKEEKNKSCLCVSFGLEAELFTLKDRMKGREGQREGGKKGWREGPSPSEDVRGFRLVEETDREEEEFTHFFLGNPDCTFFMQKTPENHERNLDALRK